MPTTVQSRVISILGLVALVFGLAVWYGTLGPAPELGAYPNQQQLVANYDHYIGDRVVLTGYAIDNTTPVTIASEYAPRDYIRLTLTDLPVRPTVGDKLRVYGVVEPGNTIRVINAVTVPESNRWYVRAVSFLAGLWVLARIIWHWRFDFDEWALTPREPPVTLSPLDRLRTSIHKSRND